jgi:uncharacterized protein (TIGR03435 family)
MIQYVARKTLLLLAATAMAFATPTAIAQTSPAQTAAAATTADAAYVPTLTFDVASIRESRPDTQADYIVGGANPPHSSLLNLSNVTVENLLEMAYGILPFQMSVLPDWNRRTMFNVQAKSDHSVDEKLAKLDDKDALLEKQHMMQAMLAERFNLKVHWETRERPVYNLVVAKGGSKLHAAGSMPPTADELKAFGDRKMPEIHEQGDDPRGDDFIAHECSIQSLVELFSMMMRTNVVDNTGLTEKYDFRLQYNDRASDEKRADDPTLWPPLTDAVPYQLGLNLKSAKGPIQVLVIDHIEKPSPN